MARKPLVLDTYRNIRVNRAQDKRFARVCAKADADVAAVVRSLMDEVIERGITYHPATGKPILKPEILK